jgi:hypothetical protein
MFLFHIKKMYEYASNPQKRESNGHKSYPAYINKPLNSQPVFSKLVDQVARLVPNQPDWLMICRQPTLIMSLSNQSMVSRIDEIILLKKHVVGPF